MSLATNNVTTTVIPLYHRLLVMKREKVTVWRVIMFLKIGYGESGGNFGIIQEVTLMNV